MYIFRGRQFVLFLLQLLQNGKRQGKEIKLFQNEKLTLTKNSET